MTTDHSDLPTIAPTGTSTLSEDDVYEAIPDAPPSLGGSDAHCGCFGGIEWVWMPPWGPDKITDDGRDMLRALGFNIG